MTTTHPQKLPERAGKAPRRRDTPLPQGRVILQPRDIDLLSDLYAYGCMLRGQIQKLHFGSVQRANLRLRQLFDARFVARAEMPFPSCTGAPSGCQAAYLLGYAGIPVVAAHLGIDPADVRRQQRHGTPGYLLHTVEIVNLRLEAEEAVRSHPEVRLERFLPERLCLHAYQYREREGDAEAAWRREVYKPDAVMLLAHPGGTAGFAIEVDLGHTASAEFLTKSRIHGRYARSGLFARRYGTQKACTLCVTTGATRRDNLCGLLHREGHDHFLFSTFADIRQEGILGSVWHRPGGSEPIRLLDNTAAPLAAGGTPDDLIDETGG